LVLAGLKKSKNSVKLRTKLKFPVEYCKVYQLKLSVHNDISTSTGITIVMTPTVNTSINTQASAE